MTHTLGKLDKLPMTRSDSYSHYSAGTGTCLEGLGVLMEPDGGFRPEAPLGMYYTAAG